LVDRFLPGKTTRQHFFGRDFHNIRILVSYRQSGGEDNIISGSLGHRRRGEALSLGHRRRGEALFMV